MKEISTLSHQIKVAQTQFDVHELLRSRWSARSFQDTPLPEEEILTLIEAASWAPSSMNEQPWRYKVVLKKQEKLFHDVLECLMPGNQSWAHTAPVLILSLAELKHVNGHPNAYALYDVGAANQNLLVQAAGMGILGHQMGGFDATKTRALFQIPEHQTPVVIIALGYPDVPEKLHEPFHTREITPRSRKNLDTIVEFV